MHREEIMKLQMTPFLINRGNLERLLTMSDRKEVAMMNLLFLYYSKLLQQEIISQYKLRDVKSLWEASSTHCQNGEHTRNVMRNFFKVVISTMPAWSSFRMKRINLEELEKFEGITWENLIKLKRSEKKKLVFRYCKERCNKQERYLLRTVSEPAVDSLDFARSREVVYFYSKRVYQYLFFAKEHIDVINHLFQEEHDKILKALKIINHPLVDEDIESTVAMKNEYIVGLYFGAVSSKNLSDCDYNWNFFVAMYVLERLLDLASGLFAF